MPDKNQELQRLLDDIKVIRASVVQSGDELRKVIYTLSYRINFWFGALAIMSLSAVFYFFIKKYGAFGLIPSVTRTVLIISLCAAFLILGFIKNTAMFFLKKVYPRTSLAELVVRVIGKSMILSYIVIISLGVYLSVYFGWNGHIELIFPVVAIGIGILFTFIGGVYSLIELTICALLLLIPGMISIPFILSDHQSVCIWVGATFGTSFMLTALYMEFRLRMPKRKE